VSQSHRAQKVADRIKVVVAGVLEGKIKDPRLGFVTITDTRVTGDLQHASVFYTVLGDEDQREATAIALDSAKGVIRAAIGRDLALPESAKALESLLDEVHKKDAEVIALRANATFAGDAEPYKAPRDKEDETLDG
jgi:ribosome-binding factor A